MTLEEAKKQIRTAIHLAKEMQQETPSQDYYMFLKGKEEGYAVSLQILNRITLSEEE